MTAIDVNAGYPATPLATYNNVINNFAAGLPAAPGSRCNDAVDALGLGTGLNGYPLECERDERFQAGNMAPWFPLAAVNRFDLMPTDASTCGEQRLIMASNATNRMFLIFEAQIPNPNPGCAEACRPIAEFWHSLSTMPIAGRRNELEQAFLTGHPNLSAAGFGPFMSADNLSFGSGQIRSNNFDQGPWTLREHKLVDQGGVLVSVEVAVEGNVYGLLWDDTSPWPNTSTCEAGIIAGLGDLTATDVNLMGLDTPPACWAVESREDATMDYEAHLAAGTGAFEVDIANELAVLGVALSPDEIARRAVYAGSCIGCHEPAIMSTPDLGGGVVAQPTLGFVHVSEGSRETCTTLNDCWEISPALKTAFLPHREATLTDYLSATYCTACSTSSWHELMDRDISYGDGSEDSASMAAARSIRVANIDDVQDVEALLSYEQAIEASRSKRSISGAPLSSMH